MTTYGDIYTKFLIEYDKANVTSSYPSLTVYEIAIILDKAYLALIAQKLTGNNPRRLPFEADIKAIEDLRPLVTTKYDLHYTIEDGIPHVADNMKVFDLDDINRFRHTVNQETGEEQEESETETDLLYYIDSAVYPERHSYGIHVTDHVRLINHYDANKFYLSTNNIPVIKDPVGYLEDHYLCVLYDPFKMDKMHAINYQYAAVTYIKKPLGFVTHDDKVRFNGTEFELGDSMAEELINLAIVMALETVESPRLNTKVQTRALES